MNHTIKNDTYTLTVSEHGAEIKSLIKGGFELMWQADPRFWGRTSPVLFPLVGNYWNKTTSFEGREYNLSQHGFARDMDFSLVKDTENELLFELNDTEETLTKYPFKFKLQIGYSLTEDGVKVTWIVNNPSDREMYFSIGGHPAFNCKLEDSQLLLLKDGKPCGDYLKVNVIAADGSGCLSEKVKEFSLNNGSLQLSSEMFDEDALIVEEKQADTAVLLENGKEVLRVAFDAPLFGIWSPTGKNAPFVCIEPWYGRCDRVGFSEDISKREFGNSLLPKAKFEESYNIK